jgi:hypothetical protein
MLHWVVMLALAIVAWLVLSVVGGLIIGRALGFAQGRVQRAPPPVADELSLRRRTAHAGRGRRAA